MLWSPESLLARLRHLGARRLRRVTFRRNRRTLWSLTRRGTALNLHRAYADAPDEVVHAFAMLVRHGGRGEATAIREAGERVRSWPPVLDAVRALRRGESANKARRRCAGNPLQRAFLQRAYGHLNRHRLDGRLPPELTLRFSRRMRRSLGHLRRLPAAHDGGRAVDEIALNLDLLLQGNEGLLLDTLLHEMAHAAAWLFDADGGHGPAWRRWADRVGCVPRRCHEGRWIRRAEPDETVTRVPPDALFLDG